jgi:hypothetical protein
VLHRLAEAQVDAERQRTDQLGQADAFEAVLVPHPGATLTLPTGRTPWGVAGAAITVTTALETSLGMPGSQRSVDGVR